MLVRFPRSRAEEQADREQWPRLPGVIVSWCGEDEWQVCVESREVATAEDGTPAPADTPDEDLCWPCLYWDCSEIKQRPPGQ